MTQTRGGSSYWQLVGRQFARNRLALWSLFALGLLATLAASADLIAGNKPLYMKYRDQTYFPAFRQYLVHTGLGDWPKELRRRKNLKRLKTEARVMPPIPYGPSEIVLGEKYAPPSANHLLGTDRLGRDVLSGIIHGSRYALVIGLVSVGISLLIGVMLGALQVTSAGGRIYCWHDSLNCGPPFPPSSSSLPPLPSSRRACSSS